VFVLEKQPVDPETGDFLSHPTELYRMVEGASYTMFHRSDRALYTVGGTVSTLWCADRSERGTWSTRSVLSWTFALLDPRLSPDSRNVAMIQNTDRARDLIVISLDDDSAHHVASFETTASSPAWSPDGGRIALCASNGSGKRVWLVDASGGPPRVLSQRDCGGYVYWNTDARIRYQSVEEMYRNYFFIDPLTGEESALFHGEPRGSVFHSSISPDGRWMAVGGNRNGFTDVKVWLIDVLSQEERLLYDEPAAPIGWSGDRGSVFLTLEPLASRSPGTGVARILRVPVSGEEAEVVLELPQGKLEGWGHADISPDGNRVVAVLVQNGQNLWVADCALPDVKMP
jgi:dipeptidyl aminopeptidase/acylaminoacyl peptidase